MRQNRVHVPLKRVGRRGSGEREEIAWGQALDEIADKVTELVKTDGAESVAMSFGTLHGADWGIGECFMNLFGSPNTVGQDKICYGPPAVGESLTYGFGPTTFTYPVPGKTCCVVIWGMRPSAPCIGSSGHSFPLAAAIWRSSATMSKRSTLRSH